MLCSTALINYLNHGLIRIKDLHQGFAQLCTDQNIAGTTSRLVFANSKKGCMDLSCRLEHKSMTDFLPFYCPAFQSMIFQPTAVPMMCPDKCYRILILSVCFFSFLNFSYLDNQNKVLVQIYPFLLFFSISVILPEVH